MSYIDHVASALVLLTGAYLVALAALCTVRPAAAASFLGGFARTPVVHGIEVAARILIGAALLHSAPRMHFSTAFKAAGWVLVVTSVLLALVPWRLHARFASAAVPRAVRYLPLIAAGSSIGGALVIWAWSAGLRAR